MRHKFENGLHPGWPDGFHTENTILKSDHYQPEVLIAGTFNHGWPWNPADFFYGRGMYMWTVMANLFLHNVNVLRSTRNAKYDTPTLPEIFEICRKGKLAFADIVAGVKPTIPTVVNAQQKFIDVNDGAYSWEGYKDSSLDFMGTQGWLDDNVDAIVRYVHATPSIKHVYFTFKSGGWVVAKKDEILHQLPPGVVNASGSIFTPSGQGFGHLLPEPFNAKAFSVAHVWVWNGLAHAVPVNREGYAHLGHEWLKRCGANPNHF